MRVLMALAVAAILLPLGSCGYFWLAAYPREVQRETRGPHSVVAYSAPTRFLSPELMVGSLHNNTAIDVALLRGSEVLDRSRLLAGEDLPGDHLPLTVAWQSDTVTVTEGKLGKSVTFKVSSDDI